VRDNGPGMENGKLEQLFQGLNSFSLEALQNEQGVRPGLFVSWQIVRLHGGHIGACSDGLGHGSLFFVELPVLYTNQVVHSPAGICVYS
jgi:K+-sensing histidine kinase KdpD